MILIESTVVAAKDQISADLGGESVILAGGTYYGLDEVGTVIWDLIKTPKQVTEVRDALLAEYDVEREQCEHEILALLEDMAKAGLVEIVDGDCP